MFKIVLITIGLSSVLVLADNALEINQVKTSIENSLEPEIDEGRKSKFPFHHLLPFHALCKLYNYKIHGYNIRISIFISTIVSVNKCHDEEVYWNALRQFFHIIQ